MSIKEKESVETRKNLGEFDYGDVLEIATVEIVKGKLEFMQWASTLLAEKNCDGMLWRKTKRQKSQLLQPKDVPLPVNKGSLKKRCKP